MLTILSPAKKLDFDTPVRTTLQSQPEFLEQANELAARLRTVSAPELARLMKLSPALAELNVARYAAWQDAPDATHARAAALAFNGDAYQGLRAAEFEEDDWHCAQTHLALLSGLYGVLRPLDLIQPHRLEMSTRLANARADDLYGFWRVPLAQALAERVAASGGEAVLLNLASQEYFKAVDPVRVGVPVVECVFQELRDGAWKIISFNAKRARGLMARFVVDGRLERVADLRAFDVEGYAFASEASTAGRMVFRRTRPTRSAARSI